MDLSKGSNPANYEHRKQNINNPKPTHFFVPKINPTQKRRRIEKVYPVHDLDAIIRAGLIVVLEGIQLMLNSFFCAKLEHKSTNCIT